jgi:hypothetical protein
MSRMYSSCFEGLYPIFIKFVFKLDCNSLEYISYIFIVRERMCLSGVDASNLGHQRCHASTCLTVFNLLST